MFGYFRFLPDFARAIIRRWNTACGIVIGIGSFVFLAVFNLGDPRTVVIVTLSIMAVLLAEATYGVYRTEHAMRSEFEKSVRISAKVDSWAQNYPDPGKDKESLEVHLLWEMWATETTATDQLALNLIYVFKKHRWQFWGKGKSPQYSMTRNGQDSNQYRRTLLPEIALQPDKDHGVFTWVGDKKALREVRGFELELVLVTGMPVARYSVPVDIDWNEINSRGTNPPL